MVGDFCRGEICGPHFLDYLIKQVGVTELANELVEFEVLKYLAGISSI